MERRLPAGECSLYLSFPLTQTGDCPLTLINATFPVERPQPMNTLYYGDNLKILREYIKDETVDLVYLDPPFNSNRNYNVLFRDESGI